MYACAVQYGAQPLQAAPQQPMGMEQYPQQHHFASAPASSSVYVKNLPPEADKLFLYEKFAPHGGISSLKVGARLDLADVSVSRVVSEGQCLSLVDVVPSLHRNSLCMSG